MMKVKDIDSILESISVTHKFDKEKLIFLNTSDVYKGRILTGEYTEVKTLKGQAKKTISNGDILFSEIRPRNKRYAYVDVDNPEDYVVSTKLMVLRNKSSDVHTKYVYHFLTFSGTLDYLQMRAENRIGSFPQITFDIVKALKLNVPDRKTQEAIVNVIHSIDNKIELNDRINSELEAMAKAMFDYWFLQYDFPNRYGKAYRANGGKMEWSSELEAEIPIGWKVGFANDLFDFNPPSSLKKGVQASYIDMDALPIQGFMTNAPKKKGFSGGAKFRNGDVVMARITPCLENGKTGLITQLEGNEVGFGSTEFIVIRGKEYDLRCFGACLSRSELFRKYAIANMTGTSGRKRVEAKTLERFRLAIPDKAILEKFEQLISPYFQMATANARQNQILSALRDWLLPMLMNGQVKISKMERELALAAERRASYKTK